MNETGPLKCYFTYHEIGKGQAVGKTGASDPQGIQHARGVKLAPDDSVFTAVRSLGIVWLEAPYEL